MIIFNLYPFRNETSGRKVYNSSRRSDSIIFIYTFYRQIFYFFGSRQLDRSGVLLSHLQPSCSPRTVEQNTRTKISSLRTLFHDDHSLRSSRPSYFASLRFPPFVPLGFLCSSSSFYRNHYRDVHCRLIRTHFFCSITHCPRDMHIRSSRKPSTSNRFRFICETAKKKKTIPFMKRNKKINISNTIKMVGFFFLLLSV